MSLWIIEPRDPLIFRDGRPFSAIPGARAVSLPFPYPSTLAGAMRTRSGWDNATGFDKSRIGELKRTPIRGPILVQVDPAGNICEYFFPAPNDSLLLKTENQTKVRRIWLKPVALPGRAQTAMPDTLLPVSANPAVQEKQYASPPHFWRWSTMQTWLTDPAGAEEIIPVSSLGLDALSRDTRVHVSIDTDKQTAGEGLLFQTVGLEFLKTSGTTGAPEGRKELSSAQFFALALETDATLQAGPDFLGGERRIVDWQESNQTLPKPPDGLEDAIARDGYARLILVTPAIFERGYLPSRLEEPSWLEENVISDLKVTVVAAIVPRAKAVSGWDFEKKSQKASRRLASAGSVYFLKLDGEESARRAFVQQIWLRAISDKEQDRLDGFGLALIGAWNGHIEPLQVEVNHA